MDRFDLSGDVILVAGGGGLLGEPICKSLDSAGADVLVADILDEEDISIVEQLESGQYYQLDITDPKSVSACCNEVLGNFDRIDGLVNVAYPRTDSYGKKFESVEFGDWVQNVTMHLGGYYAMSREVALAMLESGRDGSIVNFGSIYGMQGPDFSVYDGTDMTSPVEYSGIKGAILNLTRYLASYLGPDGIRVNAVSPGGVFNGQDETFVKNYEDRVPIGRMATPEDVCGAVIYLLSDASSYVTGQNIVVDGGWTIS